MKLQNGTEYTKEQAQRDTNPTAPAIVAMILYNNSYASSGYGTMGFYDRLTDYEKEKCNKLAKEIKESPLEEK